jgi:DHA1 family bicyclomycin/chloramphenicol resistance-like MFS transporter
MTKKQYFAIVLILGSMTALAPFSIDMYLPGFPAIAKDLHTSAAKVSLSLTGFFIGISAGQLLYGPLLDKYGRKPPLFCGLVLYVLASLACAFSHNIDNLILLRFVEAIGSCAATVTAVAMVRDLFPPEQNAKVFSLLILVLGASPMIAPTLGGYITDAYGWHYVFIILSILGALILLACILWLPDVYKPNKGLSLKPPVIIKGFYTVFVNPQFLTYTLTSGAAFAGLFAYVAGSPLVFMTVFGLSGKVYGWIFAFLSIGFIGSSQLNNLLMKRWSSRQIINTMILCYAVLGTVFFIVAQSGWLSMPLAIVFLFLSLACIGITSPNASSLALQPFTHNAGTAASLMGAIQMGLGALVSALISLFEKPSASPMAGAIACSGIIALVVLKLGRRKVKQ